MLIELRHDHALPEAFVADPYGYYLGVRKRRASFYVVPKLPAPVVVAQVETPKEPIINPSFYEKLALGGAWMSFELASRIAIGFSVKRGFCSPAPSSVANAMKIIESAALEYGVTVQDIIGPLRKPRFVRARHMAIYRVRMVTDWSLPRLGRFFGGRDHTTCLNAIRKMQAYLDAKATEGNGG